MAQAAVRQQVLEYVRRLTEGCGRPQGECGFVHCCRSASFGPPLSKNEAAMRAIQLVREHPWPQPCAVVGAGSAGSEVAAVNSAPAASVPAAPRDPAEVAGTETAVAATAAAAAVSATAAPGSVPDGGSQKPPFWDMFVAEHTAAQVSGDWRPVVRLLGSVFSNPGAICDSFLVPDSPGRNFPGSAMVNYEDLMRFYELVVSEQQLRDVFMSAVSRGLQLGLRHQSAAEPKALRHVMILLAYPLWFDPDAYDALGLFVRHMNVLTTSETDRGHLQRWFSRLSADRLLTYVTYLNMFVTARTVHGTGNAMTITRDAVLALDVLRVIYTASRFPSYELLPLHFAGVGCEVAAAFHPKLGVVSATETHPAKVYISDDMQECSFSRFRTILPPTAFLCDSLNHPLMKRGLNRRVLQYAFALDAEAKAVVMKDDAQRQMQAQMERVALANLLMGPGEMYLVCAVDRNNLIETAMECLRAQQGKLKMPLKVKFLGEEGIDQGGVGKEFFQLIVRQLFPDPTLSEVTYDMWDYDTDTRTFWFNKNTFTSNVEFELLGIILGLAIYNGVILDIKFPHVVYMKLCDRKPTLEDFRESFPALGRSLTAILDHDDETMGEFDAAFDTITFAVEYERFGAMVSDELKPGGSEISLTRANRYEYVDLYMDYVVNRSVREKFGAFKTGFMKVVGTRNGPGEMFESIHPHELELLVVGSPALDFEAFRSNCRYDDGFTKDSVTIQHFWEVVNAMTEEEKKKLLAFSTGSDRVPIGGLGSLPFTISRGGPDSDRLPTAHTCFNHLLLPDYQNKEKLENLLKIAIRNSEGFGMI